MRRLNSGTVLIKFSLLSILCVSFHINLLHFFTGHIKLHYMDYHNINQSSIIGHLSYWNFYL